MLPRVIELRVEGASTLWLRFSDGAQGRWDLAAELIRPGPLVAPLRDPAFFARAFLDEGAPTWPNGFDAAPDALHEAMARAGALAPSPATHRSDDA